VVVEQHFSFLVMARSGVVMNGERSYATQAQEFSAQFLSEQYALLANLHPGLMGLTHSMRIDLGTDDAFLEALAQKPDEISAIADVLIKAYKNGKRMVLFGNGGSAADCQHIAAEIVGGFCDHERPGFPALSLTTDTSALTSIGNDFDFATIFSRQVEAMVNPGDVVLALSTSGNSPNVIKGAQAAKKREATVVGFTGDSGGKLKDDCDYMLRVPSKNTAFIQEGHMAVGHILCGLIEKAMTESN